MSATYSVEELIRIQFDKLYENVKMTGDEAAYKTLEGELSYLETKVVEVALDKKTTESEEIYDEGYEFGRDEGYDEGYEDGYSKGHDDGYDKGFEDGKSANV